MTAISELARVFVCWIFPVVYGLLGAAKLRTTSGAIKWLRTHGVAFRKKVAALDTGQDIKRDQIHAILDSTDADKYGIWGVLDYRLLKKGWPGNLFARIIFRVPILAASAILIVFFGSTYIAGSPVAKGVWLAVAIIYQVEVALICIEGMFAYITLGSYRRNYHINFREVDSQEQTTVRALDEISMFVPIAVTAIIVNVTAFCVAQIGYAGFASAQLPVGNVHEPARLFWNALYFVSTTFSTVGYGDITPQTWRAQLVTMLMHAQGLLLIVGMFSALISFGLRNVDAENPGASSERRSESPPIKGAASGDEPTV